MSKKAIVTQIGSLPFEDVAEAVAYSVRHDIPFLPELPRRGDAMLEYIKNPGQMSCLEVFRQQVKGREVVKLQCVGPATLILSGYSEDDAVARICEHVTALLDGLEVGQVILFLDEPALGHAGFDFQSQWTPIFESFAVVSGIHTCGNMNWDLMFDSEIEIISFDASQFDLTKYPGYRSGKRIAWGINGPEDVKDYQEGDLLTLPCGMGPKVYEPEECEPQLQNLLDVAQNLSS
jgi:hypothetical protein